MLTNMLDTPVPELPVGNDVDVGKNLFDAGALGCIVSPRKLTMILILIDSLCHLPGSSQRYSELPDFPFPPTQPHATCRGELH